MSTSKAKAANPASISAHPAFPAVVALWFAALLGLGCLVVPVVLFEMLFSATGIASLIPAAAPPLGPTARISIALVASLFGAGIGLFLARKVVGASGTAKEPRRRESVRDEHAEAANPKRPISAREELGSDSFDAAVGSFTANEPDRAPARLAGRRRALSVTDESERSEFLDHAPLPGGHAAFDPQDDREPFAGKTALDLGDFTESDGEHAEAETDDIFATLRLRMTEGNDSAQSAVSAIPDSAPAQTFAAEEPQQPAVDRPFEAAPASPAPTGASPDPHHEDLSAMNSSDQPAGVPSYNPLAGFAPHEQAAPEPAISAPSPAFAEPATAASIGHNSGLQGLGMVELVERFARALQSSQQSRHALKAPEQPFAAAAFAAPIPQAAQAVSPSQRAEPFAMPVSMTAQVAVQPHTSAPTFVAPQPVAMPAVPASEQPMVFRRQPAAATLGAAEPAPEQTSAAQAASTPVSAALPQSGQEIPRMPQALRAFAEHTEEPEDEGDTLDLSFPRLGTGLPPAGQPLRAADEVPAEDEYESEHGSYPSLLSMKGRFGSPQPFVRIEDEESAAVQEPVVVFPGQENRRAEPASDGPSRDALSTPTWPPAVATTMRPFDAPSEGSVAGARPASPANAGETERALREALEKLQRMSGAG
ncbi:hypothetical protein [Parerythrobacter lacustris]|uniref:DUF308 domain-containing protein n=1 Tax=Parerythrobacter lacustris TaxID=2969984 RepID=A0ABT1XLE2_9SPHN|nr:hypothetical protein [Parerythrobacter lacustris]MCR2832476.1 hypothetical protein [Parerythrobacter lacustris]